MKLELNWWETSIAMGGPVGLAFVLGIPMSWKVFATVALAGYLTETLMRRKVRADNVE